ncbi:PaREP1 family protein, partial [Caldivirga sp.]|uniref:PaREP1 family protein n=1 Tax=Caldivirga sp. TaxID=2080243 RepID=UPI003D0EF253
KGDVVQASEELYKAVEEAVKALAIRSNLPEAKETMEGGRWTVSLLDEASWKLGNDVERAWVEAYFLHVNGFHEIRIGIDEVRKRINVIKKLIDSLQQ